MLRSRVRMLPLKRFASFKSDNLFSGMLRSRARTLPLKRFASSHKNKYLGDLWEVLTNKLRQNPSEVSETIMKPILVEVVKFMAPVPCNQTQANVFPELIAKLKRKQLASFDAFVISITEEVEELIKTYQKAKLDGLIAKNRQSPIRKRLNRMLPIHPSLRPNLRLINHRHRPWDLQVSRKLSLNTQNAVPVETNIQTAADGVQMDIRMSINPVKHGETRTMASNTKLYSIGISNVGSDTMKAQSLTCSGKAAEEKMDLPLLWAINLKRYI